MNSLIKNKMNNYLPISSGNNIKLSLAAVRVSNF